MPSTRQAARVPSLGYSLAQKQKRLPCPPKLRREDGQTEGRRALAKLPLRTSGSVRPPSARRGYWKRNPSQFLIFPLPLAFSLSFPVWGRRKSEQEIQIPLSLPVGHQHGR